MVYGVRPGEIFGKLTVIKLLGGSLRTVRCKCECGHEKITDAEYLHKGYVKSCGCLRREIAKIPKVQEYRATKGGLHGHGAPGNNSRTYVSWQAMLKRCFNRTHCKFPKYGGRGITVCDRWLDFRNFLTDMGERPSKNHTIDRINNDGNFRDSRSKPTTN